MRDALVLTLPEARAIAHRVRSKSLTHAEFTVAPETSFGASYLRSAALASRAARNSESLLQSGH